MRNSFGPKCDQIVRFFDTKRSNFAYFRPKIGPILPTRIAMGMPNIFVREGILNLEKLKILRNQRGQGLTEYLIIMLLVAIVSIAAARTLGSTIKKKLQLAERHIKKDMTLEDKSH